MTPLISIIIPTYNRADIIGKTLETIINQTYTNWECIVVDDGSVDDTSTLMQAYVKKDSRFKFHQRPIEKFKGPNSCRNYGFSLCKGEIINFFDSDDFYKNNALEHVVTSFNEVADVVISKVELIDFNSGEIFKENNIISNTIIEDFFVENITYYVSGPFWRTSFLKKQPYLFDETIGNGDDWDFNLRMLYENPKKIYMEEPNIQIRIHSNSFSREKRKFNKTELESELRAINKQFRLIKKVEVVNSDTIKKYILRRYNSYFMEALYKNSSLKYFLLKKLLLKEIHFNYYKQLIKTIFGFVVYTLFKRGYKYLHIK